MVKSTGGILKLLQVLSFDDLKALKAIKNESLAAMKEGGLEPINEALEEIKNEALEAIKNENLAGMKNEALEQNVNTETIQVFGNPGRSICEQAQQSEVDLIVMGSRGLSGLQKLILGSVSSYVIRHAYCSVLVVRKSNI